MDVSHLNGHFPSQVHAKLLLQAETGAEEEEENDAAEGDGGGKSAIALELLPFPQVNVVDFGSVHINERAARKVR